MQKVIDAYYFQSPDLQDYLSSSSHNQVIFCDYACMEGYKGNALISISKSLKIISKYPNQAIVLKGTREIVKITNTCSEKQLFFDKDQTQNFRSFCSSVTQAAQGNEDLRHQILDHGRVASDHLDNMRRDAQFIADGIRLIADSFSSDHLRIIRDNSAYSLKLLNKILNEIYLITDILFEKHPDVGLSSSCNCIENSYLFRYALCSYLLVLRWISVGGASDVKLQKLRNDMVDMHYIAYSTYFDGLLSNDKKMLSIYEEVNYLLRHILSASKETTVTENTKRVQKGVFTE